ncbi:unnamed protein product [Aspergillus oryzae]|uniref:Unnamed protein product n=2 Tax=Aspergillus subgen. Circumdati TaxID=2720871 RepID=A0AAN4YPQ4_ASPOZ|nr:unnamed protein product [Aspergillus oryzae]GMF86332.1 unnamed protein product [Aspergillus oryzae]GMG02617.1 unnamed protein product [Aspergillus oryzae]GMG31468.1 unnamed protein product [Aspergillus oryzae]
MSYPATSNSMLLAWNILSRDITSRPAVGFMTAKFWTPESKSNSPDATPLASRAVFGENLGRSVFCSTEPKVGLSTDC